MHLLLCECLLKPILLIPCLGMYLPLTSHTDHKIQCFQVKGVRSEVQSQATHTNFGRFLRNYSRTTKENILKISERNMLAHI
jgi:hypothetical protein